MQSVFRLTERNSSPFLRFSLAIVFAWYGALKLINPASAIHLLHVSVFSFLASPVCVYILGSAEIIVGLLLAFGLWVRCELAGPTDLTRTAHHFLDESGTNWFSAAHSARRVSSERPGASCSRALISSGGRR